MYVSLQNSDELAFYSGYTGQRAVRSWKERLKKFDKLSFIRTASGTAGEFSHAVILNPHFAIRRLHAAKTPGLTAAAYNALFERAIAISAEEMNVPPRSRAYRPRWRLEEASDHRFGIKPTSGDARWADFPLIGLVGARKLL